MRGKKRKRPHHFKRRCVAAIRFARGCGPYRGGQVLCAPAYANQMMGDLTQGAKVKHCSWRFSRYRQNRRGFAILTIRHRRCLRAQPVD